MQFTVSILGFELISINVGKSPDVLVLDESTDQAFGFALPDDE